MTRKFKIGSMILLSLIISSCGKVGAPIPPEQLAPKPVYDVEAIGYDGGLVLKWTGDTKDLRSKELKSMNGYLIEKACENPVDNYGFELTEKKVRDFEFKEVAIVNDNQVLIRERLREEAKMKGLSMRRVSVPKENLRFNFVDEKIRMGETCFYKITPFNQDDVKGLESEIIKVLFKGKDSIVSFIGKRKAQQRKVTFDNF